MSNYKEPVCRGSWMLRNNCGTCERCLETMPKSPPYAEKMAGDIKSHIADLSLQIRKLQVENKTLREQRKKLTDDLFFTGADAADEIDRLDAEIQQEVSKEV